MSKVQFTRLFFFLQFPCPSMVITVKSFCPYKPFAFIATYLVDPTPPAYILCIDIDIVDAASTLRLFS